MSFNIKAIKYFVYLKIKKVIIIVRLIIKRETIKPKIKAKSK